jgi:hypothetical protein
VHNADSVGNHTASETLLSHTDVAVYAVYCKILKSRIREPTNTVLTALMSHAITQLHFYNSGEDVNCDRLTAEFLRDRPARTGGPLSAADDLAIKMDATNVDDAATLADIADMQRIVAATE